MVDSEFESLEHSKKIEDLTFKIEQLTSENSNHILEKVLMASQIENRKKKPRKRNSKESRDL